MRILTGLQPSGRLHFGNYFGAVEPFNRAIRQAKERGEVVEPLLFVADYHALTTTPDPASLRENVTNMTFDLLSLTGYDVDAAVFLQSDVPAVCELAILLANVVGVGLLERNHSFKDKVAKGISPTVGLFNYPVLMAADILLYEADFVPVGKDQVQHLEIARDIAEKFNHRYGNVLKVPQALISDIPLVPGLDGQKMSKSYGNTIGVFETPEELLKKIRSLKTAVGRLEDPESNVFFQMYKLFLPHEAADLRRQMMYDDGIRYGDLKAKLAGTITENFKFARLARQEYEQKPYVALDKLARGVGIAKNIAQRTLEKVREAMGIN